MGLKLSIVLLNYQGESVVYNCLKSIFSSSYSNYELIFVDNNSSDGSYEKSLKIIGDKENVTVVRNKENFGFTRGFDIGIRVSNGEYILLLNNDTVLYENALMELVKFMDENPNIGLAEGRIENVSDTTPTFSDPRIAIFFGWLIEAGEHVIDPKPFSNVRTVFSPVGVWPIIRRKVYDEIGGYDNDFIHFEEIRDLAARVWIFGYEVGYVFEAVTQHIGRLTDVNKNYGTNLAFQLYFHSTKNQVMFFFKNFSTKTIIKFYFPYIIMKIGDLFYTLFTLGHEAFFTKIRAYKWFLRNSTAVMAKRRFINKNRRAEDNYILRSLVKVDRSELMKLITLRRKYDKKTQKWTRPS